MTFDFTQVTEVELSTGSHTSPEGGLCFMEMAAWFAGEKHSDKPECACPALGAYGIRLNDEMPNGVRNSLLRPLVPQIVGTRDPSSEQSRTEFLAMWAVNKIIPIALRPVGLEDAALACEDASNLSEAKIAALAAARATADAAARAAARAAAYAADAAAYDADAADAAAYTADAAALAAARAAAYAADAADAAARAAADVWHVAVEGLRQAILIGRHEPQEIDWQARHDALREMATHQGEQP